MKLDHRGSLRATEVRVLRLDMQVVAGRVRHELRFVAMKYGGTNVRSARTPRNDADVRAGVLFEAVTPSS